MLGIGTCRSMDTVLYNGEEMLNKYGKLNKYGVVIMCCLDQKEKKTFYSQSHVKLVQCDPRGLFSASGSSNLLFSFTL